VLRVSDAQEIEGAISRLVEWGAGALLVGSGPFLYSNRQIITTGSKDAVAKLALPPGVPEHLVWDDDVLGFGIRLSPHR